MSIKKCIYTLFPSSFRFTEKLSRKYRVSIHCTSFPNPPVSTIIFFPPVSTIINMLHYQAGTFVQLISQY